MQTIFASARFDLADQGERFLTYRDEWGDEYETSQEPDALDCPTVSFDEIEAELALEFFDAEAADERRWDREHQLCYECGAEESWDDDDDLPAMHSRRHVLSGDAFCCAKCHDAAIAQFERFNAHRAKMQRRRARAVTRMSFDEPANQPSWELRQARADLVNR